MSSQGTGSGITDFDQMEIYYNSIFLLMHKVIMIHLSIIRENTFRLF